MGQCCSSPDEKEDICDKESEKTDSKEDVDDDSRPPKLRKNAKSGLSRYSTDDRHVIESPLKIGAFNVRRFGPTKMVSNDVVDILVKIIRQFDIICILEVVDTGGKAIDKLLDAVNADNDPSAGDCPNYKYRVEISPRLGRSSQKEQYAFFYRTARVWIKDTEVYEDPGDVFIREPFIVQFNSSCVDGLEEFTVIAIHTQPKCAVKEIDRLVAAHDWTKKKLGTGNVLIMGDFNAGGDFVKTSDWEHIRLKQDKRFTWLIPDYTDTTATSTLAAYDRIVTSGDDLAGCIVPDSAKVYRYDEDLNVNMDLVLKVSDHFPVSVCLRPSLHPFLKKMIKTRSAFTVSDKRFPVVDFDSLVAESLPRYKMRITYEKTGHIAKVDLRSHKMPNAKTVVRNLERLRDGVSGLISYSVFSALKYKLGEEDDGDDKGTYWIVVSADLTERIFFCSVETEASIV